MSETTNKTSRELIIEAIETFGNLVDEGTKKIMAQEIFDRLYLNEIIDNDDDPDFIERSGLKKVEGEEVEEMDLPTNPEASDDMMDMMQSMKNKKQKTPGPNKLDRLHEQGKVQRAEDVVPGENKKTNTTKTTTTKPKSKKTTWIGE